MDIGDLTVNLAMMGALILSVISVTAMFVTLREKVQDHETRLRHHSDKIAQLDSAISHSDVQFARIMTKLEHIEAKLNAGCLG